MTFENKFNIIESSGIGMYSLSSISEIYFSMVGNLLDKIIYSSFIMKKALIWHI